MNKFDLGLIPTIGLAGKICLELGYQLDGRTNQTKTILKSGERASYADQPNALNWSQKESSSGIRALESSRTNDPDLTKQIKQKIGWNNII